MTVSERSFHLLGVDTVLRPDHDDELAISYVGESSAKAAYDRIFASAADGSSGMYKALQFGALLGRSGSWIIVRWQRRDTERYVYLYALRYFRSAAFDESFEVFRGAKKLK